VFNTPQADKLDTGQLTIYEELAMLYGSLCRINENHTYYSYHEDDLKVLSFGVRILSNIKDLELARKDLYVSTYTGIQQKCLVNDANLKAKATSKIVNHYTKLILSYL